MVFGHLVITLGHVYDWHNLVSIICTNVDGVT